MKGKEILGRFCEFCISKRLIVVGIIGIMTVIMGYFASQVSIKTVFADLLPQNHPYIKVNNRFKETFGGSNMVCIMVEVEKGTIFNYTALTKVQKITTDLQYVVGVNPFQIISLASKKLKDIRASTEGIESIPLMWPNIPRDDVEMAHLRDAVLKNTLVYERYVSRDLKATLITVDFYDHLMNYPKAFKQIRQIAESVEGDGVKVRVVGEPMLYGWVDHYLPETTIILTITFFCLLLLLFIVTRTLRGTLIPLMTGTISAIWALGFARLLGYHVDPLGIVLAFLITARGIAHSVQMVTNFDDELALGTESSKAAAKATLQTLFKPAMLGIVTDAGGMVVVATAPIPILQKAATIGTFWMITVAISALILTPVVLSWVKPSKGYAHPLDISPLLRKFLHLCIRGVLSRHRYTIVIVTAVIFVVSGIYTFNLTVGDAHPGSPILWPDSSFNVDATEINRQFQGADRMFVVMAGEVGDTLKEPEVLENMEHLQRFMEAQPEVGGSLSLTDVIPVVKRQLREGNPRYMAFGRDAVENGEILFMYISGTEPGDMDRYCDPHYWYGAVNLYFRDHKGDTIRTATSRVKEFIAQNPLRGAEYQLAGGLIGVLAAANEVILSGQIKSIALALLILVICTFVGYRNTAAGIWFMVPVVLSNIVTFAYIALKGIGMNINTVPVAALGIGLGVNYSYYVVDGIRERLGEHGDMDRAIIQTLSSQGRGVLISAVALIVSVVLWYSSSLRFQAEMALLLAIWFSVSALASLFLMPALVYIFRPEFIVGKGNRR